ncbi:MAG TPA: hypothetical protein DEV93_01685 [Chloroflexi bacterium]|nr:hypothetical protein [Chloroflexota bacterium]
MRTRQVVDRLAGSAARGLLARAASRLEPSQRVWADAVQAEFDVIEPGVARLAWAVGGLRVIWLCMTSRAAAGIGHHLKLRGRGTSAGAFLRSAVLVGVIILWTVAISSKEAWVPTGCGSITQNVCGK